MDERLEKALEFSNYQKTLETKKNSLKMRLEHTLMCSFSSHIFKATKELISFISLYKTKKSVIVEDSSGLPVKINKPKEFYEILLKTYNEAFEEYYIEYESLKKSRNIKKLTE